eukprot:5638264-Pleurochrysis_carterae.AAC.3
MGWRRFVERRCQLLRPSDSPNGVSCSLPLRAHCDSCAHAWGARIVFPLPHSRASPPAAFSL